MIIPTQNTSLVNELISQRQNLLNAKQMFNSQYEVLSKYFYQTKKDTSPYSASLNEGNFLNDGSITDNVGAMSAAQMASAIVGAVWKNEKRTFRIVPSKFISLENEEIKQFYHYVNNQITMFMERPKSRFETSLGSEVLGSVVYGTAGCTVQQGDYVTPLKYQDKSILNVLIGYNGDGEIDTVCIDYYKNAKELFLKYGFSAGSDVMTAYNQGDLKRRFLVTETIRPRINFKADLGKLAMPYESFVFLSQEQIVLEEGGYEDIPIKFLFYEKLEYESYGRSPAMKALPSVMQANTAAEIIAIGGESMAQPPLGVYDNGSLQGKVIDFSPAAINVFDYAGTVPTSSPVFPLYSVGDLRVIYDWWNVLHEQVGQYFLLDKLYDLNSNQRMTLGEANIRNAIRSDALAGIFAQVIKFLTEIIERSMDILFGMGLIGVIDPLDPNDDKVVNMMTNGYRPVKIPAEVLAAMESGIDWYAIDYISPAARTMKTDELQATTTFLQVMMEASQVSPDFIDVIDPDGTTEKFKELLSADLIMLRPKDQIKAIRENRQQMQNQIMQLDAERTQSQTNQSNAQAQAAQAGAMRILATGGMNG